MLSGLLGPCGEGLESLLLAFPGAYGQFPAEDEKDRLYCNGCGEGEGMFDGFPEDIKPIVHDVPEIGQMKGGVVFESIADRQHGFAGLQHVVGAVCLGIQVSQSFGAVEPAVLIGGRDVFFVRLGVTAQKNTQQWRVDLAPLSGAAHVGVAHQHAAAACYGLLIVRHIMIPSFLHECAYRTGASKRRCGDE